MFLWEPCLEAQHSIKDSLRIKPEPSEDELFGSPQPDASASGAPTDSPAKTDPPPDPYSNAADAETQPGYVPEPSITETASELVQPDPTQTAAGVSAEGRPPLPPQDPIQPAAIQVEGTVAKAELNPSEQPHESEKTSPGRDQHYEPPTPQYRCLPGAVMLQPVIPQHGDGNMKRHVEESLFCVASQPPEILSDSAVYNRLWRIFKRRQDGSKILDERWSEAWADVHGGGRDEVKGLFEKEKFIKRCTAISQKILEETSEVEGEWLTVADMQKCKIKGVIRYCEARKGLCRKTKRRLSQEAVEWDEENSNPDQLEDTSHAEWSMLDSAQGANAFCAISLSLDDANEQEKEPVQTQSESADVQKEMKKHWFPTPMVEGDRAPSSLIPEATKYLQKMVTKVDALHEDFKKADGLSALQLKKLGSIASAVSAKRSIVALTSAKPTSEVRNAERDMKKVFQDLGFDLPIPINPVQHVVPLMFHGDEGRAVKKTNYFLTSVESPIGAVEDPSLRCTCKHDLRSRLGIPNYGEDAGNLSPAALHRARQQITNFKGHSYLSRFLLFGIGGWVYKKRQYIIDELLSIIASDMVDLFNKGVRLSSGDVVFGALVATKGDLDFQKRLMNLERCYSRLGTVNPAGICHLCLAGNGSWPFEDFKEEPAWKETLFQVRPWPEDNPPSMSLVPYDHRKPEAVIHPDLFHTVKDVVGGVLVTLLRLGFYDHEGSTRNIVDRLERGHSRFALWCATTGHSPGLRSFTKSYFNLKNMMSAPWSNSKGSDTTLLLKWLVFEVKLQSVYPTVAGHQVLLDNMLQVMEATLNLGIVHKHGLWLDRECARRFVVEGMTLLRGYAVLGRKAMLLGFRAFIQKPKAHSLHHICAAVKTSLEQGASVILSPQATSCEVNEDFVGRISRLSRRVGFRLMDLRVCERYFLKISCLLRTRKQKRRAKG
ncbi:unnamed protein product [Durusdinium trenchii]|uniref:Uncharacterized protein n=1 Tax=Durusdinium trenchii TaxID=1381693 RepID=A0ABP0RD96_9DINO